MSNLPSPPPYHYHSCPPSFCSNPTKKPANMERVDSLLLDLWTKLIPHEIFTRGLMSKYETLAAALLALLQSSRDGHIPRAEEIFLELYKSTLYEVDTLLQNPRLQYTVFSNFSVVLVAATGFIPEVGAVAILDSCGVESGFLRMQQFSIKAGTISYAASTAASSLESMLLDLYPLILTESGPGSLGWGEQKLNNFLVLLAAKLMRIVKEFMESGKCVTASVLESFKVFGGNRLLVWSNLVSLSCTAEILKSDYEAILDFARVFKAGVSDESMELLKLKGDELAKNKDYIPAIAAYQMAGELSKNVNARVNCAALRLRIAKDTDVMQFHHVVVDCTFALELEPNHVKALFRRGLALCKLKMWNEGIVDFERAIELDSRSPAVQELAWAGRQVTRRLGA